MSSNSFKMFLRGWLTSLHHVFGEMEDLSLQGISPAKSTDSRREKMSQDPIYALHKPRNENCEFNNAMPSVSPSNLHTSYRRSTGITYWQGQFLRNF